MSFQFPPFQESYLLYKRTFHGFFNLLVMQNLSKCIKGTPELRMRLMDNSSHALEVFILFFNRTVRTEKAKRVKRFYSLLCLLLRLTNRKTDKWTVGYLSVYIFILAPKYSLRTPFLRGTAHAWGLHFTRSSKPRKGLVICRARAVSSIFSVISRPWVWSGPGNQTRDLPLKQSSAFPT